MNIQNKPQGNQENTLTAAITSSPTKITATGAAPMQGPLTEAVMAELAENWREETSRRADYSRNPSTNNVRDHTLTMESKVPQIPDYLKELYRRTLPCVRIGSDGLFDHHSVPYELSLIAAHAAATFPLMGMIRFAPELDDEGPAGVKGPALQYVLSSECSAAGKKAMKMFFFLNQPIGKSFTGDLPCQGSTECLRGLDARELSDKASGMRGVPVQSFFRVDPEADEVLTSLRQRKGSDLRTCLAKGFQGITQDDAKGRCSGGEGFQLSAILLTDSAALEAFIGAQVMRKSQTLANMICVRGPKSPEPRKQDTNSRYLAEDFQVEWQQVLETSLRLSADRHGETFEVSASSDALAEINVAKALSLGSAKPGQWLMTVNKAIRLAASLCITQELAAVCNGRKSYFKGVFRVIIEVEDFQAALDLVKQAEFLVASIAETQAPTKAKQKNAAVDKVTRIQEYITNCPKLMRGEFVPAKMMAEELSVKVGDIIEGVERLGEPFAVKKILNKDPISGKPCRGPIPQIVIRTDTHSTLPAECSKIEGTQSTVADDPEETKMSIWDLIEMEPPVHNEPVEAS